MGGGFDHKGNHSGAPSGRPTAHVSLFRRSISLGLFFAAVGPLVGLLLILPLFFNEIQDLVVNGMTMVDPDRPEDLLPSPTLFTQMSRGLLVPVLAWIFGGPFAVATGVVLAIVAAWRERVGYLHVVFVAFTVSILVDLFFLGESLDRFKTEGMIYMLLSVAAAVVCRFLFYAFLYPKQGVATPKQ